VQNAPSAAGATDIQWYNLYPGLPLGWQIFFVAVFALILTSVITTTVLAFAASSMRRKRLAHADPDEFLWVFLVPALNEEVTIADSVARLAALRAKNKVILVINDGSDDRTGEILADMDLPDLQVLTRVAPNARVGKAAALNDAWRHLHQLLTTDAYRAWSPQRVITVVIDADGRLSANSAEEFSRHFANPEIGGVQALVRIYNRRGWLTWAQDVEFAIFGRLFQQGRARWGTANMGGNGQANRLSALDEIAVGAGPWRDKLTEDQDLGVRLLQKGWRGSQDLNAQVEQQGVNSLRRLVRQRTRWSQGAWEATVLVGHTRTYSAGIWARIDAFIYLLTPIIQLVILGSFLGAIGLAVFSDFPLLSRALPMIILYVSLSFLPGVIGLLSRAGSWGKKLFTPILLIPYTVYTWIILPVVVRALARIIFGRTTWAKTAREPIQSPIETETN